MKYCAEQGCKSLIASGRYCENHKRKAHKGKSSNNKAFYNSQAWRDLKSYCYERDKGLCVQCKRFVFGKRAQHHHKIPISVRPDLKLDEHNVITTCPKCHMELEQECDKKYNHLFKSKDSVPFSWKV